MPTDEGGKEMGDAILARFSGKQGPLPLDIILTGVDLGLEVGLSKRDIHKLRWVFTHRN